MLRQKSSSAKAAGVISIALCVLFLCVLLWTKTGNTGTRRTPYEGNSCHFHGRIPEVTASEKERSLQLRLLRTLASCSGLQRHELLALSWDEVDFENSTIAITKTAVAAGEQIMTLPMPQSCRKIVSIPRSITQLLRELKCQQPLSHPFVFYDRDASDVFADLKREMQ